MVQSKVAIYCRVSTADQSCQRQEHDLAAYAQKAGWEVVGVWKETASGSKDGRQKRNEVIALAQARKIDLVLVTELTRWGRSTLDLIGSLQQLNRFGVSIIAQTGLQFDLSTSQGKLIANIMSSLAEFESDVIKERVRSGIAAAKARGKKIGRQPGQLIKSGRIAPKVLKLIEEGKSYRAIASELNLSKTTITDIVKRHRAAATTLPSTKKTVVILHLRIERNSKFVRGIKKTIEDIEYFVLPSYRPKKLSDREYELEVSYDDDKDLDDQMNELLMECQHHADLRNCFSESDVKEKGKDRHWD